jgi:hypothetical protein
MIPACEEVIEVLEFENGASFHSAIVGCTLREWGDFIVEGFAIWCADTVIKKEWAFDGLRKKEARRTSKTWYLSRNYRRKDTIYYRLRSHWLGRQLILKVWL